MSRDLFASMAVSASGMSAQRKRMEAIAENIANAETTRSADGDVYKRKRVALESAPATTQQPAERPQHRVSLAQTAPGHLSGAAPLPGEEITQQVNAEIVEDADADVVQVYDPEHPDADEDGFVKMPDVNTVSEMVDMISATRAYEANLSAMKAYQNMIEKSLEI